MIAHAGLVARRIEGRWRGALIEGPSGAGKSDLALRILGEPGFRLVADDRVVLWTCAGALFGRAPDALSSLFEARGVGILDEAALPFCEVVLLVRPGAPERLPEPEAAQVAGAPLPVLTLAYREASAPAKLGRALAALYLARQRRM